MGRRGVTQVTEQEIMEEISDSRRPPKISNKMILKKEEMNITASAATAAVATVTGPLSQVLAFKGQPEDSLLRRMDTADDLQLMCTKKCIPCHRCGSSMKFFMRRVKYLNTVKEYPAYRCMKKKCQTFRSPRTLARECNMLLRQGFGDGRFMSVAPTTNATRQLKEAFPDHFSRQEIDALQGFPASFRDDFTADNNIMREKEAWCALNNAKRSLDALAYTGKGLSLRLHRIIGEIHTIAGHCRELPKKEESLGCSSRSMETDRIHDLDDEGYDSSLSMRRSTATDLTSLTFGGDSRSSFDTEIKSETSSVDTNISVKMPSSTSSALSSNVALVQPIRWINISRHSPSFSVKMVDNTARRAAEQEAHPLAEQPVSTTAYESLPTCTSDDNTHETPVGTTCAATRPSLPNTAYDQPSTSYNYGATTASSTANSQITKPSTQPSQGDSGEKTPKNEPLPIYVRPSELCFDDVTDGGEILSEFFIPSTSSNFQPVNPTTTNATVPSITPAGSNTTPVVRFAQLWNFNEHYDHKEANPPSQATTATICPL